MHQHGGRICPCCALRCVIGLVQSPAMHTTYAGAMLHKWGITYACGQLPTKPSAVMSCVLPSTPHARQPATCLRVQDCPVSSGALHCCSGGRTDGDDVAQILKAAWRETRSSVMRGNGVAEFNFRQYLFACQARLLFKLNRPAEVRLCSQKLDQTVQLASDQWLHHPPFGSS